MKSILSRITLTLILALAALASVWGLLEMGGSADTIPIQGNVRAPTVGAASMVSSGLVGYWPFDEGSGTVAGDQSGYGNDGDLLGDPVYTTATPPSIPSNYALDFDGAGDYVRVNGVADDVAGGGGAWSAAFWMKAPNLSSGQDGLLAINTADGGNVVLLLLRSHKLSVYDGGSAAYEAASSTIIDDDAWHHVAYVSDGSTGTIYVDGDPEGTHAVDYSFATDDRWSLGQEFDPGPATSDFLTGQLDDVRVYNRALDVPEIRVLAFGSAFRYVAPDGNDTHNCDSIATRCRTVQRAVDVANPNDQILVAQGTYSGVQARPAPAGYPYAPASGLITQVVHITKSLGVWGGYSADFGARDPAAYPTTLDAQGEGRAIFVGANIDVSLGGLHVTGGDAAGLGGGSVLRDIGGGVCAYQATTTIDSCQITANNGGGVGLNQGRATLRGNTIQDNIGPGVFAASGPLTLEGNAILGNTHGGIDLIYGSLTARGNVIRGNATPGSGGGVSAWGTNPLLLENNVIAGNQAGGNGDGLYLLTVPNAQLRHNTIVGDGDGSGVMTGFSGSTTLVNNIVVRHTVGITVEAGTNVTLQATLWGDGAWDNGQDWGGAGSINHTLDVYGDPDFVNPAAGDYHIGAASAAVDAGVNAGVNTDIDGEMRPLGGYDYDIGADEYSSTGAAPVRSPRVPQATLASGVLTVTLTWQPPTNAVTYTLYYSTGVITAENWGTAILLTDTLPGSANTFTATVPYSDGTVYFALRYWNSFGHVSDVSHNAFWPNWGVYIPVVSKDEQR